MADLPTFGANSVVTETVLVAPNVFAPLLTLDGQNQTPGYAGGRQAVKEGFGFSDGTSLDAGLTNSGALVVDQNPLTVGMAPIAQRVPTDTILNTQVVAVFRVACDNLAVATAIQSATNINFRYFNGITSFQFSNIVPVGTSVISGITYSSFTASLVGPQLANYFASINLNTNPIYALLSFDVLYNAVNYTVSSKRTRILAPNDNAFTGPFFQGSQNGYFQGAVMVLSRTVIGPNITAATIRLPFQQLSSNVSVFPSPGGVSFLENGSLFTVANLNAPIVLAASGFAPQNFLNYIQIDISGFVNPLVLGNIYEIQFPIRINSTAGYVARAVFFTT
jgi:hypothetical protein